MSELIRRPLQSIPCVMLLVAEAGNSEESGLPPLEATGRKR